MKNILLIGGSYGIGLAIIKELENKNNVFVASRTSEAVDNLNVTHIPFDVTTDILDVSKLPAVIDGLVYCPGSINLRPFERIKPEDFEADYKLQVIGAIRIIQMALPRLKKAENASIVLFSTLAVQTGLNFHTQVAASKGAIEGLTKSLAAEFAPKIRVNCIAPSLTNTPLAASLVNTEQKMDASAQRHPLKRIGTTADIANMAAFLLSEKASWITGQILHVDGGMSSLKV